MSEAIDPQDPGRSETRGKADESKREATEELRELRQNARKAGVSITRIASEAGLSRQGVYDLWGSDLPHSGVEPPLVGTGI